MKKIDEKRIKTGKEYLLPKDEHELMFSFIKEANKVNRQISTFSKQVDYCYDESFNYSDEIAMMLKVTPEYQKISQNYGEKIKKYRKNKK